MISSSTAPHRSDRAIACAVFGAALFVSSLAAGEPLVPPREMARDEAAATIEEQYLLRLDPTPAEQPVQLILSDESGQPVAWLESGPVDIGELARAIEAGTLIDFVLPESSDGNPIFDVRGADPLELSPRLRVQVGRTTALRDGGIEAERIRIDTDEERLRSFAEADGEYDLYDLSLAWRAGSSGPLSFSLIGGVKAIKAEVSQTRIGEGPGGGAISTLDQERGVIAVPVVGGGVNWDLGDGMLLTGTASTHTLPGSGSFLDLTAETSIMLRPNVGIHAGYQYIRSVLDVQDIEAELAQEGLYARVRIAF